MRVLHVMECTIGGARRHMRDVAREQTRLGLDVSLCVSTLRDPAIEDDLRELQAEGVRVFRLPMRREIRPASDARHGAALARLLRRERPDVVHTHSSKAGVLGRAASIATGIGARVHTPHTFAFLFEAMFSPAKRSLFRALERGLAERTDAVVAVSQAEGRSFRTTGVVPPERVRVVENGIDARPFLEARALDRAELGVPQGQPLCLVVGLLNAAKGQDLALRALTDPRLAQVHLVFAGHGEDEPLLRRLTHELGLGARVHFLGWRDDVPALLASADVLLLPSRWEAMPYAVLEAMAAGLPVASAPVDGAIDLIEDGLSGTLAASGAPADLAQALARLFALDGGARAEFGMRGRARVVEHYSARAMAAGLVRVYGEVLGA